MARMNPMFFLIIISSGPKLGAELERSPANKPHPQGAEPFLFLPLPSRRIMPQNHFHQGSGILRSQPSARSYEQRRDLSSTPAAGPGSQPQFTPAPRSWLSACTARMLWLDRARGAFPQPPWSQQPWASSWLFRSSVTQDGT